MTFSLTYEGALNPEIRLPSYLTGVYVTRQMMGGSVTPYQLGNINADYYRSDVRLTSIWQVTSGGSAIIQAVRYRDTY